MANLQLDISGAPTSTISYNGLNVKAEKATDGTYRITVDVAGLTWGPDAKGVDSAEATVVAGWYDAKGKLLGHVAREEFLRAAMPRYFRCRSRCQPGPSG